MGIEDLFRWASPAVAALLGAAWALRGRYGIGWTIASAFAAAVLATLFAAGILLLAAVQIVASASAGEEPGYAGLVFAGIAWLTGVGLGILIVAALRRLRLAGKGLN